MCAEANPPKKSMLSELDENIFHEMASESKRRSRLKLFTGDSLIEELNAMNFEEATPLDVAIDYENWNMLRLLMQFHIREENLVKAIGELLSHYWHTGSSTVDQLIFQLIIKKGHLSKEDCIFLVERAFDGNAWPFVAPLWHCSDLPQHRVEQFFHWQVADYPLLRTALSALLTKVKESCVFGESIFIYSDDKLRIRESECFRTNEKKLLSFIYRRRKIVVRSMKKSVYRNHITYRLIKGLMYMY